MVKRKRNMRPFWRLLFLIYSVITLWLLFGRSQEWIAGFTYRDMIRSRLNIVPFETITRFLNVILHHPDWDIYNHCLINLVGNVVLFIPAGFLIPRCFPVLGKFLRFFAVCFAAIVMVEMLQLMTLLGYFDVDDITLNLLGMVIGYLLHLCFRRK